MGILNLLGLRRKSADAPASREPRISRVTVHLRDGPRIVHYARMRTVAHDGRLTLWLHQHDDGNCSGLVAEYVADAWIGVSLGKRHIQPRIGDK